jgi:hypothetical protein
MGVTRHAIDLEEARVTMRVAVGGVGGAVLGGVGALGLVGDAGVAPGDAGMLAGVAIGGGLLTITSTSTVGMAMAVP